MNLLKYGGIYHSLHGWLQQADFLWIITEGSIRVIDMLQKLSISDNPRVSKWMKILYQTGNQPSVRNTENNGSKMKAFIC